MKRYMLDPMDYALFRDARPFSPDELSFARTATDIPLPKTVYGMLRALLIQESSIDPFSIREHPLNGEFGAVLGSAQTTGTLSIRGPFLGTTVHEENAHEMFLPYPADVITIKEGGGGVRLPAFLRPCQTSGVGNWPCHLSLLSATRRQLDKWVIADDPDDEIAYELGNRYLKATTSGLEEYLISKPPFTSSLNAFHSERHIGLERGADFKAVEGMLYGVEFVRPAFRGWLVDEGDARQKSVHYVVEIMTGDNFFPPACLFTMGGERRPFRITELSAESPLDDVNIRQSVEEHLIASTQEGVCRFRLYLLTPAIFRGHSETAEAEAWIPDFLDPKELGATIDNVRYTLKSAAVTRSFPVSGWNMKENGPRSGWRAVPAGAVYFLEARALDRPDHATLIRRITDTFWLKSICGDRDDQRTGFGCVLIGGYKNV